MAVREDVRQRYGLRAVDAWWVVLVIDPIAMRIIDLVRDVRWITPNLVSLAAIGVGCISAAAFAAGRFLEGAVLFQLRFLLDCIDGKLARIRHQQSRMGWFLDHGMTFPVATLIGLGWAYGLGTLAWEPYGLVLIAFFLVALANYLLFGFDSATANIDQQKKPIIGRLNPRPTYVECELLLFTIFPIAVSMGSNASYLLLVSGVACTAGYSVYMLTKQVRLHMRGE